MTIDKEDVIRTAEIIGISVTDDLINQIIEEYPSWVEQDPTATWNLIIEDMLYCYRV